MGGHTTQIVGITLMLLVVKHNVGDSPSSSAVFLVGAVIALVGAQILDSKGGRKS